MRNRLTLATRLSMMGLDHQKERRRALWLVLEAEELPGTGWVLGTETTWLGGVGTKNQTAKRARKTGKMIAERRFQSTPLWLVVQVIPTPSSRDAERIVSHLNNGLVRSPHSQVFVTAERVVDDINVDTVDHPWLYERLMEGPKGSSTEKFLGGVVGDVIHLVHTGDTFPTRGGPGSGWSWQDVIRVGEAQSQKLKRLLGQSGA